MNLHIESDPEGLGGYSEHVFSLEELRGLAESSAERVRSRIKALQFLRGNADADIRMPLQFSTAKRIQTMFLHTDAKLRAVLGSGRQAATWIVDDAAYMEAQSAGLAVLQRTRLSERARELLEEYLFIHGTSNGSRLLFKPSFTSDASITPSIVASYQKAVIEAAGDRAVRIGWKGGDAQKVPMLLLAPGTPHFREVDGGRPFPTEDGVEVVDICS